MELPDLGKHCSVGVPIPLEGRTWGELYLTRTADQPCFDDADTELALLVAAQIGAALATADHLDTIDKEFSYNKNLIDQTRDADLLQLDFVDSRTLASKLDLAQRRLGIEVDSLTKLGSANNRHDSCNGLPVSTVLSTTSTPLSNSPWRTDHEFHFTEAFRRRRRVTVGVE